MKRAELSDVDRIHRFHGIIPTGAIPTVVIPTGAIPTPLVGRGRGEVKWSGVSFGGVGSGLVVFERCRFGSSRLG
jgi:hypothetical protein